MRVFNGRPGFTSRDSLDMGYLLQDVKQLSVEYFSFVCFLKIEAKG